MNWVKKLSHTQIAAILIFFCTFLVFSNSLKNQFVWEDAEFIQKNNFLTSVNYLPQLLTTNIDRGAGKISNLYRPLQSLSHFIDMKIWGNKVWGHRITSVILHATLAVALFYLFLNFFQLMPAALCTLLFALHPLQSESVAYTIGRTDTMAILFCVLALLSYGKNFFLSLFFAFLAILSKESMILFPAFLFLFQFAQNKWQWQKAQILRIAPFVLLSVAYLSLRFTFLNFQNTFNFYNAENILTENYSYRFFTFLSTIPQAFMLWLAPYDLHHARSWSIYTNLFEPKVLIGLFILIASMTTALYYRNKHTLISIGIAWIFLAMLPTSNLIILINSLFYDHWFILPGLGFLFFFGFFLNYIWQQEKMRPLALIACTLMLLASARLTLAHNQVWSSQYTLFDHILKYEPNSEVAHNNLAMAYSDRGEDDMALEHYKRALEINSRHPETHHNIGRIYLKQGNIAEAIKSFNAAIEKNNRFHYSWTELGQIALQKRDLDTAVKALQNSINIYPYSALPYIRLIQALNLKQDQQNALRVAEFGLKNLPNNNTIKLAKQQLMELIQGNRSNASSK